MIKFFRKIRQQLLSQNRFSKYMIYAIGEIILVVIGILIALQINNWNNNKIDNAKIKASLQDIHNELVKDSLKQIEFIEFAKKEVDYNLELNQRAKSKSATLDTLVKIAKQEFHYRWIAKRVYSTDSYENLKASSIYEKISDTLKIIMTDFYNTQNYWDDALIEANNQYRERLDDFTKTYSVIHSDNINKEYTFISGIGWTNVDPRHFNPRFFRVQGTHLVLYQYYLQGLEEVQIKSRNLISFIKEQIDDQILP